MRGGIIKAIAESLRPPASRYGMPIYGDWPFVCEEMRTGRKRKAGGESRIKADPSIGDSHCHRGISI